MATQMGNRLVFENAKTLIQQLGYDASHAVLTPSFLRSEVLLTTTSASYHVPVLVNDNVNGTPTVREQRLALQDLFIVKHDKIVGTNGSQFIFKGLERDIMGVKGIPKIMICYIDEAETIWQFVNLKI